MGTVTSWRSSAHEVKNLIGGHAALQRPQVGRLNDRPFGRGIGEGDAQLDEVGAVLGRRPGRRRRWSPDPGRRR